MGAPDYIVSQRTLFGHDDVNGFGDVGSFEVKNVDRTIAVKTIRTNHYSHTVFPNSTEHHAVFIRGSMCGVLQWGSGMNPASGSSIVENTKQGEWLELNRMWLSDCAPRNSESRAISYSIKLIKRQRPQVRWVQSFADERCGVGVVYQSAGFIYLGRHTAVFWELDGVMYHNIAATVTGDALAERPGAQYLQENMDRATRHVFKQYRYWKSIRKGHGRLLLTPLPYEKPNYETAQ